MTIEELKEHKATLEQIILEHLDRFEKLTGVYVSNICYYDFRDSEHVTSDSRIKGVAVELKFTKPRLI